MVWDRLWRYEPSNQRDDELLAREEQSPRWAAMERQILATFGTVQGLRTVELGAGRGDLSVLLARRGASVTLVDCCDRALSLARRRFERLGLPVALEKRDFLQGIGAVPGKFNVALSSGVIEHFRGSVRTDAIRAHRHVLRAGGLAVISVPHARCLPYRIRKIYLQWRGWWPYGLEIPYTKRELTARILEAGFGAVVTQSLGFWQSISSHWARGAWKMDVDWSNRRSPLDAWMGFTLLAFARCSDENGRNGRTH